jgi:diguanylate cyclase
VVTTLAGRATAALSLGDTASARDAAEAALAFAHLLEDPSARFRAAVALGHVLLAVGKPDAAERAVAPVLDEGDTGAVWRAPALAVRAAAAMERGQLLSALDALAEELALVESAPGSLDVDSVVVTAAVLVRLALHEAAVDLLQASSPALPIVRALVWVQLVWAAQLEVVGEGRRAEERFALAASAALRWGRLAAAAGGARQVRAAVAAEAYVVARLGLPGLAAARARDALATAEHADSIPELLPGLLAVAADAWERGDADALARAVGLVERFGDLAPAGLEPMVRQMIVEPALARLAAPPPGAGSTGTHPAVPYLQEIASEAARWMWRERDARSADLRQRIVRRELTRRGERTARELLVDPLTGLGNRRRLEELLSRTPPAAALFVDLDHFKRVNDLLGHPVGDAVLRRVAALLLQACRADDVVVRYGGDEFVILPASSLAEAPADRTADGTAEATAVARRLGQRVLELVRRQDWSDLVGSLPVTVSVGVASGPPGRSALAASDTALLAAKRAGRDTLVEV